MVLVLVVGENSSMVKRRGGEGNHGEGGGERIKGKVKRWECR